jgi:hypothetical protein
MVACAFATTTSADAGPPSHGTIQFVCDGFTGCYIGGLLTDSCSGDFVNGPFQCLATANGQTFSSPAPDRFVQTTCAKYNFTFDPNTGYTYFLVYQSHGTIIGRNNSDGTVVYRAICGPNELTG